MRSLPGILAILLLAAGAAHAHPFESSSTGYLIPSYGYESVLADFNGDGLTDIATLSMTPGRKIVVFRNLGGRAFEAMDTLTATGDGSLASADLNADGNADLVAEASGKTSIWLGNGDFTFGARTDYTRVATAGRGTAVGNVVGDGLPDVVAPDSTNVLVVWRNTGGGALAVAAKLAISGRVDHVRLADIDHDLDLDLIVSEAPCTGCNPVNYQVRVIRNLGGGSFAAGVTYAVGPRWGLNVADLDGDTHPDIVAGAYRLKGLGNGSFDAPVLYGAAQELAPTPVDLNQDGQMDLVSRIQYATSGTPLLPDSMVVRLGIGGGVFGAGTIVPTGYAPNDFRVADFDGDTHPDVVATCNGIAQIVVHWGNGAGGFGPERGFAAGGSVERVAIADITGDGVPDVLALSPAQNLLRVLRGEGGANFSFLQDATVPGSPVNLAVGDFDADLNLDVAVITTNTLRIFPGLGAAGLGTSDNYPVPGSPDDLAVGDVTGDGIDDVVISALSPGTLCFYPGIADSGLGMRVDIPAPFTSLTRVEIASSTGDPLSDIVLFGSVGDDVRTHVYPGLGGGSFDSPVVTQLTTSKGAIEHDLADLNGDGAPETISILGGTSTTFGWIYFANLDGSYVVPGSGVPLTISLGRGARRMAYGDFDQDGFTDIAACQQWGSGIAVFRQRPEGTFEPPVVYGAPREPYAAAAGDLDGDGWDDLVVADRLSQTVTVLRCDAPIVTAVAPREVRTGPRLAITRLWPTVARTRLHLECALPARGALGLEAFDVAGRRLFERELGEFAPGLHAVTVELPADLPPGLLWIRARQGGLAAAARVVIAR